MVVEGRPEQDGHRETVGGLATKAVLGPRAEVDRLIGSITLA